MAATYRAAYWIADDGQSSVVLTSEEQADLHDDDLIAAALEEAKENDLDLDGGRIVVGYWTAL